MLMEETLRNAFWQAYQNRARGGYMFEVPMENKQRKCDLIVIERYLKTWQVNAFEFKLNDYGKVLEQASANARYSNRSWIVMPEKKENHLRNHSHEIRANGCGAMIVRDNGRYEIVVPAPIRNDITMNQVILDIAEMNSYKPDMNY